MSLLEICKYISLTCSALITLFLLLHDWIDIYPLNDLATFNKHCSLRNKVLMTIVNTPFFMIYTALLLLYCSTPFPWYAKTYLIVCNVLFSIGIICSWWAPYLFGWPVEQTKELRETHGTTHTFLPAIGNNPIPNTLHVLFHLVFFINMITTIILINPQPQTGTIIILNGPSAAGKSSIQKQFQKISNELYLTVGIDNFFDTIIPDVDQDGKSIKNGELIRWVEFDKDKDEHQTITLHVGPTGYRVIKGMHRAIAAYAQQNNNIIMDYILYDPLWLPDLIDVLKDYKVYLIGIHTPLEIIEQRESKRGTSPIGHARSHYHTVHKDIIYDLNLDTSLNTPEELAQQIKNFIHNNPSPQALKKLK